MQIFVELFRFAPLCDDVKAKVHHHEEPDIESRVWPSGWGLGAVLLKWMSALVRCVELRAQ